MTLLSTVQPDFDQLRLQFQALLDQYPAWKDRLTSSSGQVFLNFVAGIGAYDQFSIERALQECFLDTAVSESGVYTGSRQLGVRVNRRVAALARATLENPNYPSAYTAPAYNKFKIGSLNFFNAAPIVIGAGVTEAVVDLYEGTEVSESFVGNGQAFQLLLAGLADFSAADQFVRVRVNSVEWVRTTQGLWRSGQDAPIFYESTTQDGRIEIKFGNSIYGAIPGVAAPIEVLYYRTTGAAANNFSTGLEVKGVTDPNLVGVTTTNIYGGEDTRSLDEYRFLSPRIFASGNRAVTRDDWVAIALTYPGVVDAKVVGEAELDPGNVAYQNAVGVCVLTAPSVTKDSAWIAAFHAWLDERQIFRAHILDIEAVLINQAFSFALVIDRRYSSAEAINAVENVVRDFFKQKRGTIGRSYYMSDLYDVIMALDEVVHVTIASPAGNILINYKSYINVTTITYPSVTYA